MNKKRAVSGWFGEGAVGYIAFEKEPGESRRKAPQYLEERRVMLRIARMYDLELGRIPLDILSKTGTDLIPRAGLAEALGLARKSRSRTLIIFALDRLRLTPAHREVLLRASRDWGVRILEASSQGDLTADADQEWQFTAVSDSKDQVKARRELVEFKKRATMCANRKSAGRKPFGTLPGERDIIKRIGQLRRLRSDGTRRSYQSIADELNDDRVPPRKGEKWYAKTIQGIVKRTRPHLD